MKCGKVIDLQNLTLDIILVSLETNELNALLLRKWLGLEPLKKKLYYFAKSMHSRVSTPVKRPRDIDTELRGYQLAKNAKD